MPPTDPNAHSASIAINVSAEAAFSFLADGLNQSSWALGSLDRKALGGDLFSGTSMFTGKESYIRLRPNPDLLLVDYLVGPSPDELHHEVESRVVPGAELGRSGDTCVVTNTLWRRTGTEDSEWELLYYVWKTEMGLIKGKLERSA